MPGPALWQLGPFELQWRDVCQALALATGLLVAALRVRALGIPWPAWRDALLWTLPEAVLAARLAFIVEHLDVYLLAPARAWQPWEGGYAGGAGALVGSLALWRFARRRPWCWGALADAAALGLAVGGVWLALGSLADRSPWGALEYLLLATAAAELSALALLTRVEWPHDRPLGTIWVVYTMLELSRRLFVAGATGGTRDGWLGEFWWMLAVLAAIWLLRKQQSAQPALHR